MSTASRPHRLRVAAALGVVALAGAGAGATGYALAGGGTTTTVAAAAPTASARPVASKALTVNEVYRRASHGVVEITTTTTQESSSPFPYGGAAPQQQGQGTGFVIDDDGHIVTNDHVVDGADSVRVTLADGSSYTARVVGTDASTDLAVLDVDAPADELSPLTLGSSSALQVGDGVVAIGSPFGLEQTVTTGIVSALHRQIEAPNGFAIDGAIQTDAAINPGNSGGPLLDLSGRVVGVNAQIDSNSGGNDGVGFSIPSDTVKSIVARLISSGSVEHAYLGVSVQTIPASAATAIGLTAGAEVTSVRSGTAASRAGLKAATATRTAGGETYPTGGDVITRLDGKAVASADDLRTLVDAHAPGEQVTVEYVRDGKSRSATVELGTRPETTQ
jgi:putative serine protease PepD